MIKYAKICCAGYFSFFSSFFSNLLRQWTAFAILEMSRNMLRRESEGKAKFKVQHMFHFKCCIFPSNQRFQEAKSHFDENSIETIPLRAKNLFRRDEARNKNQERKYWKSVKHLHFYDKSLTNQQSTVCLEAWLGLMSNVMLFVLPR